MFRFWGLQGYIPRSRSLGRGTSGLDLAYWDNTGVFRYVYYQATAFGYRRDHAGFRQLHHLGFGHGGKVSVSINHKNPKRIM